MRNVVQSGKLWNAIKNKCTSEEVATNLCMATVEELYDAIRKTFSADAAKGFIDKLQRNDKLRRRRSICTHTSKAVPVTDNTDTSENSETSSVEEDNQFSTETQSEAEATSNPTTSTSLSLDEIDSEISRLRDELNAKELEHKKFITLRSKSRQELQNIKLDLVEQLAIVEKSTRRISEINATMNAWQEAMLELDAAIGGIREKLANYEDERKSMFTVWVYHDGNIDASFDIPAEWETSYVQIRDMSDDEIGELTVKQLKTVAKSVAICRAYPNAEMMFEEKEVENLVAKVLATA